MTISEYINNKRKNINLLKLNFNKLIIILNIN